MNKKTALIFDLDGTLLDSIDYYVKIFSSLLEEMGIKMERDRLIKYFGSHPRNIFIKILSEHQLEIQKTTDLLKKFKKEVRSKEFKDNVKLFKGIPNTLSYLKERGYKLAIASGSPKEIIEELIKQHKIDHFFDAVVGADEVKNQKPEPDEIILAELLLDAKKEETYYIGDWYVDAVAAKKANVKFIATLTGLFDKKTAEKYQPYKIVNTVNELRGIF